MKAGHERNEQLASAPPGEVGEIRQQYKLRVERTRKNLKELRRQQKENARRIEYNEAQGLQFGATQTPATARDAALVGGGGGQAVIGVAQPQPAAVWRPVGKGKGGSHTPGHKGPGTSYAPPSQRLSKLESARARAQDALVVSQRERAAEVAENKAWLAHLDEEIYRAGTQMHAAFKGDYSVVLSNSGREGVGMTLQTDNLGAPIL